MKKYAQFAPLTIFLVLLIGIVLHPYFHAGLPITHDGENHLARFANYKVAVREGQIPPRFAPNLMNHYGYPVFNYNYPLANLLSVPFSFIRVPYEVTFKILVTLSILVGVLGVNSWLKALRFPTRVRWLSMIVYLTSPYVFASIFFRGNIGEVMALALLPWLLWSVEEVLAQTKMRAMSIILMILFTTAFVLCHNIAVLFGLPLVVLYAVLRLQLQWVKWRRLFMILTVSVGLSLWFWLPAFFEKSLITLDSAGISLAYLQHFPTLSQLLFSPLTFGYSYPGSVDSGAVSVGLLAILVLISSVFLLIKKWSRQQQVILGCFVLSLTLIVFQLPLTQGIWQGLPLGNFIQFPWRLSLFFTIFSLPLYAWCFDEVEGVLRWLFLALVCVQILGVTRAHPTGYFQKTAVEYEQFAQSTSTQNENLPANFTYEHLGDWKAAPSVATGSAEFAVHFWNGSSRSYSVVAHQQTLITEPTMKFAGWETRVIRSGTRIRRLVPYVDSPIIGGRIAYQLEAGSYEVTTRFTQRTPARLIGNAVSLITGLWFASFVASTVWKLKKRAR